MEEPPIPKAEPGEESHDEDVEDDFFVPTAGPLFVPTSESLLRTLPPNPWLNDIITTCDVGIPARLFPAPQPQILREWWHNLLREYGRFYCYGVFLVLEADAEALKYMTEYALELNQASGKNCAILGLGELQDKSPDEFDKLIWSMVAYDQVREGYSLKIAELFHIPLTRFPGLILFRDIRSPEHILVNLRGLTAEEIAEKLRGVYQAINQAADAKKDPLKAVGDLRRSEEYRGKTRSIISGTRKIAGKTLEAVIEAVIKAMIP